MSDYIDTREGWREVSPDHRPAGPGEFLVYDGATNRAFSSLEAERPDHWRGQDYMDGRTAVAESILEILG